MSRKNRSFCSFILLLTLVLPFVAGLVPAFAQDVGPADASTAGAPADQAADLPYFPETGYRIANAQFADYFAKRGGLRTFGYPVSRAFLFLGTQVQFFQRQIMQVRPDGGVGTLNILDAD